MHCWPDFLEENPLVLSISVCAISHAWTDILTQATLPPSVNYLQHGHSKILILIVSLRVKQNYVYITLTTLL